MYQKILKSKSMSNLDIYTNKKVFVTGHTGFKGSWLSLWLLQLGADVYGYSLDPPTNPSLYGLLRLEEVTKSERADILDVETLRRSLRRIKPDIIFHLAAQALVRTSYGLPAETFMVNAAGTVNLLEAIRQENISTAVVLVTTDKCYANKEWIYGYREDDSLGGFDPYSASKAAAEILIAAWRNSFFHPAEVSMHGVRVASARAGNVVGGGDWSKDRIVPDCIRDLRRDGLIKVRNPDATRPWQHVLEPLAGYLQLGARLLEAGVNVSDYCEAFNFGPLASSNRKVVELVEKVIQVWGSGSFERFSPEKLYHESSLLHLSIDKAYHKLNWLPKWGFEETIKHTVDWYKQAAEDTSCLLDMTIRQITIYQQADSRLKYPAPKKIAS